VVRFLQAEGVSHSDVHRKSVSVYGDNVFSERKCLCGTTNLKIAERH
jgi:hypothetical protein